MNIYKLIIMLACLSLGACATDSSNKTMASAGGTVCQDPRPQVCTMDYTPVCATLSDGSTKTYPNGCGACADASVASWVENACPE